MTWIEEVEIHQSWKLTTGLAAQIVMEYLWVMGKRMEYLFENKEAIKEIAYRNKALSIAVFGSVARGDDNPSSDYDFLVTTSPESSLFDLGRMLIELQTFLGEEVDLVDKGGLKSRDSHILKDAVLL
jgi:predicted nucleotidyltransferase